MTLQTSAVRWRTARRVAPVRWQTAYARLLLALDAVVAVAALGAAALVAPAGPHLGSLPPAAVLLLGALLWSCMLASTGAYDVRYLGAGADEYKRVGEAAVRTTAFAAVAVTLSSVSVSRAFLIAGAPALLLLTALARWGVRKVLHAHRRAGRYSRRVIVVGGEAAAAELADVMRREPYAGYTVVTHVEWTGTDLDAERVTAALADWRADTVAVHHASLRAQDLRRLAWMLEGTGAELVVTPALTNITGPRIHLRPVAGLPMLHVEEPDLDGGRQRVKHTVDRTVAMLALVALLPVLAFVALLIRTTSQGAVLFRQERLGKHGSAFTIWKFRTMYDGADTHFLDLVSRQPANAGGMFVKKRQDPRITPVGRWLRRFSIDELPQLLNVARGEMSLVGPRPLPVQVAQRGEDVLRRLLVRPGMTGLWQISGRSNLSAEEALRMDLYYVENWSLSFDAMLLWRTARAVLAGRGAY